MVRIVRIGSSKQARACSHSDVHRGPLFLQDYKYGQSLPTALQTLYELPAVKNSFQAICVVLHNMALESGFCSLSTPNMQHPLDISDALLSSTVSLDYNHSMAERLILCLNVNALGPYVIVNGLVHGCKSTKEQILTLQIKSADFVKKFDADTKPVKEKNVFKNMSKLSRLFRESILYKTFDVMQAESNLEPREGLLSLFPDILLRIFSHLDSASLCAASQTCKQFRETADGDILWRALCTAEFGSVKLKNNSSWKKAYKRRWIKQKKEEKEQASKEKEIANSQSNLYPTLPTNYTVQETKPTPVPDLQNSQNVQNFHAGMLGGGYDLKPQFPYGPYGVASYGAPPIQNPYFLAQYRPPFYGARSIVPGARYDPMFPYLGFQQTPVAGKMNNPSLRPSVLPPNSAPTQRGWVGSYNGYYYA